MEIFANHAHVFPKEINEYGTVDYLLKQMDKNEISKAITFAPLPQFFNDPFNSNIFLKKAINNNDRLYGFGIIDFNKNNIEEQVQEIFDIGFLGIKIHNAVQKISITDQKLFRVYAKAEDLGLVISFHTGVHWHRIQDCNVLKYDEIGYNFPKLKYILEHVGGYAFFTEAIAVLQNNNSSNVMAGLTSISDKNNSKYWYLSDQQLNDLIWQIGTDRCVFGLDFPYNNVNQTKIDINRILELNITEKQKQDILGFNLKKIVNL